MGRVEQVRFWTIMSGLFVLLVLSLTLAVVIGPVEIPLGRVGSPDELVMPPMAKNARKAMFGPSIR